MFIAPPGIFYMLLASVGCGEKVGRQHWVSKGFSFRKITP